MTDKKRGVLAVIFVIWGGLIVLFGALLLFLIIQMVLEDGMQSDLASNLILAVIIVLLTCFLGLLPLRKGIRILRNREEKAVIKRSKENKAHSSQGVAAETVCAEGKAQPIEREPRREWDKTKPYPERTEHRILCRDKQFDKDWSMVLLLIKMIVLAVVPIVLSICAYQLISKSVNHRIQAGTWQAWASMLVVMGGSALTMLGFWLCAKSNAVGNKFYYYILDEKDGLFFAHMGRGNLANHAKTEASLADKAKAFPSPLYVLLYVLGRQSRGMAFNLMQMQTYFNLNQKYHFVEELLLGKRYQNYCQKVVAVKRIKYLSKGCEVVLVTLQDGVEHEETHLIYRQTTNYDMLLDKIKALVPNAREGYELSAPQVRQIRKNIYRRIGILLLAVLCLVLVVFGSYSTYLSASSKVAILSPGFFKLMEQRIAGRSRRRIYRVIYFCVFVLFAAFAKMIHDIIKTNVFTYVPVEEPEYYEPRASLLDKIGKDYRYFAKVKYKDKTVNVGLSKEMWEKKEAVTALLVLRKGIPYCLIYQQTEM